MKEELLEALFTKGLLFFPIWIIVIVIVGIFILSIILMPINFFFLGIASIRDSPKTGVIFILFSLTLMLLVWHAYDSGWLEWIKIL